MTPRILLLQPVPGWRWLALSSIARTLLTVGLTAGPLLAAPADWQLTAHRDAQAQLDANAPAGTIRVVVASAGAGETWLVQYDAKLGPVRAGEVWELSFEARADQPRPVGVALAQAHDPWQELATYTNLALSGDWQSQQISFTILRDDPDARIYFDLGGSTVAVEVRDLRLTSAAAPAGGAEPARDTPAASDSSVESPTAPDTTVPMTASPPTPPPQTPPPPTPSAAPPRSTLLVPAPPVLTPLAANWRVVTGPGTSAELAPLAGLPGGVRLSVGPGEPPADGWLQMELGGQAVRAGQQYRLQFRARSDWAGPVDLRLAAGAEDSLGLAEVLSLEGTWQQLEYSFRAIVDAPAAWFRWRFLAAVRALEIADVSLAPVPDEATSSGEPVTLVSGQALPIQAFTTPPAAANPPTTPAAIEPAAPEVPPAAEAAAPAKSNLTAPWRLETHGRPVATLEGLANEPGGVRVEFQHLPPGQPWQVQALFTGLALESGREYRVRCRARADDARTLICAVSQDGEPWTNHGLHQEATLVAEWRDLEFTFRAQASDSRARVEFNLGSSDVPVELAALNVEAIEPPTATTAAAAPGPPAAASEFLPQGGPAPPGTASAPVSTTAHSDPATAGAWPLAGHTSGRGSKLVLHVAMATWCASCKRQLPQVARLREMLTSEQLEIVGVPVDPDDSAEKLAGYTAEHRPEYRLLADLSDPLRQAVSDFLAERLRVEGLPASVVTDGAGNVLLVEAGVPTVSALRALLYR